MWSHYFVLLFLVSLSSQRSLIELDGNADVSMIKPCQGDDVLSCTVAAVNVDAFDDDVLSVPECGEMNKKNLIQESLSRSGDVSKSVAYENDDCEGVFSKRGGNVFGNIDLTDGRGFVLEPCSAFEGCHVWKEEDTASFDNGEPEIEDHSERIKASNRNADALRQKGIDDPDTNVTFSIKFYFTRQFALKTDDIELYMDQVTAKTNEGYINSKIPVRMKIHCIEAAELDDGCDGKMFTIFKNYKGSVEALRGGADAVALIMGGYNYAGQGNLDSWRTGNTVTVQQKSYALGYYTLGHELGHNFGCNHDRYHDSLEKYSYGYGAFIKSPYRTIMAYPRPGFYSKANIYSSSVATWKGDISGSAKEDNARVIRENRFGMAAVGDESETCNWNFSSSTNIPGLPAQCNPANYKILCEASRSTSQPVKEKQCDVTKQSNSSPNWKGPGWYKFVNAAGTKMATSAPPFNRCGAYRTGYMVDEHPTEVGQTKRVKFCFSWKGTSCGRSTLGDVTKCGEGNFVYKLPNAPICTARYCGVP